MGKTTADGTDVVAYWAKKESEAGGPIVFKTYASFLGTEGGGEPARSGLAYATGDSFFFESVAAPTTLFGMIPLKSDFEPFSFRMDRSSIKACRPLTRGQALSALAGKLPAPRARSADRLRGFLSMPIVCVEIDGAAAVFIEAMDWKGMIAELDPHSRSKK